MNKRSLAYSPVMPVSPPGAMKIVGAPDDSGLEVAYDHTSPALAYDQIPAHEKEHAYGTVLAREFESKGRPKQGPKLLCGIPILAIIAAVVFFIIGGALGGGLGAGIKPKNKGSRYALNPFLERDTCKI